MCNAPAFILLALNKCLEVAHFFTNKNLMFTLILKNISNADESKRIQKLQHYLNQTICKILKQTVTAS